MITSQSLQPLQTITSNQKIQRLTTKQKIQNIQTKPTNQTLQKIQKRSTNHKLQKFYKWAPINDYKQRRQQKTSSHVLVNFMRLDFNYVSWIREVEIYQENKCRWIQSMFASVVNVKSQILQTRLGDMAHNI